MLCGPDGHAEMIVTSVKLPLGTWKHETKIVPYKIERAAIDGED